MWIFIKKKHVTNISEFLRHTLNHVFLLKNTLMTLSNPESCEGYKPITI